MSRHRDVRSMNYSEEYDGYDDVYGHSMEDDYCVSPSAEQFLFDRSKQQNIASFITEPDIVEDNEDVDEASPSNLTVDEEKYNLSELERAKLISCLETIRNVIGDTVSDSKLKEKIILSNFDANIALDAVLKESSPKKVTDSVVNRKQLERQPGVSVDKSNTPIFAIPRFSFQKEHNLSKDFTETVCQPNNVDSSKDINHSLKTFSSLSGLIFNHTESVNSDVTKVSLRNDTNTQSFNSLAALTANYLQKSNSIDSREKHSSPISQFVVPKLSIKKKDSEEARNVHLPKFHNNGNSNRQLVSINISGDRDIDLLQKDFSNINVFSKSNSVREVKPEERLKNPISISNEVYTSLDDWVDLSTALKKAELLTDNTFRNANLTISRKLYHDTYNFEMFLEDDNRVTPNVLPVTLNLCALRYVKLPCAKKNVSVFGKTLCKKWKTRRPILKTIERHFNTIKPFDFSTPYSNRS